MPSTVPAPPVPLSKVGRAEHDIGHAGLLGGNLFGRLAMHPSVTEISDQSERGKVVNAAWRRYGAVNSLSLAAVVTGWIGARLCESANSRLSDDERRLAYAKDALVGLVAATGLATAAEGMRFAYGSGRRGPAARRRPCGAGGEQDRPPRQASRQRPQHRQPALRGRAGRVNSALTQEGFRWPPGRRFIPRWGRL
jgi:hypothetical protein